jgi:hypothetical protein
MYGYEKDIRRIERWLAKNKVAPTALGTAAVKRSTVIQRIRKGKVTLYSLRKVLGYIDRHPIVKNAYRAK